MAHIRQVHRVDRNHINESAVFRQAGCLIDFIVGYREIVYRVFRYGIWHS